MCMVSTPSFFAGDELCESLDGQVFKYVLPPTVQTVAAARASTRRRAESPGREAPERRGRRRQRSVDDDDSDEDWGWTMERRPTARAVVVPTALQREAAPGVATPRTCDIRRLNSRLGSLVSAGSKLLYCPYFRLIGFALLESLQSWWWFSILGIACSWSTRARRQTRT